MKEQGVVDILHLAIRNEKEAIHSYLRMAKATKDVNAKNVLINLALDEVGHMNQLEAHLAEVLRGARGLLEPAESGAAAATRTQSASLETFDPETHRDADEVRILELAVDKEIRANQGYLELARTATSPQARGMFLALAKEEEMHAKILRAEIDAIGKTGFWFDFREFSMEQ